MTNSSNRFPCKCDCHAQGAQLCEDCYIYHGISYREFKNSLEPRLKESHLGRKILTQSKPVR